MADPLRAFLSYDVDQLSSFAKLDIDVIRVASQYAGPLLLQRQLEESQLFTRSCQSALLELRQSESLSKFSMDMYSMMAGPVEMFYKGLTDRIGSPSLNYEDAMRAEHCCCGGHSYEFTSGNYRITTTPHKEWLYVVGDGNGQRTPCPDMQHGRCIIPIDQLLRTYSAINAQLTRAEMIAVVLYTGPMFMIYNSMLRRYPIDQYQFFRDRDNQFSTTIFVLVFPLININSFVIGTTSFRPPFLCLFPPCKSCRDSHTYLPVFCSTAHLAAG
jgi:hypothetical protein